MDELCARTVREYGIAAWMHLAIRRFALYFMSKKWPTGRRYHTNRELKLAKVARIWLCLKIGDLLK